MPLKTDAPPKKNSIEKVLLIFLAITLTLLFSNFFIEMGSHKTLTYFSVFFLLLIGAINPKRILQTTLRPEVIAMLGVLIALLTLTALPLDEISPTKRYTQNIAYTAGISLALLVLFECTPKRFQPAILSLMLTLLAVITLYQLHGLTTYDPISAYFWNPHYLAQFSLLALLFIGYSLLSRTSPLSKAAQLPLATGLLLLLIASQSRPAWLALLFSVCLVILFYMKGRQRWLILTSITVLAAIIYMMLPSLVADRLNDLIYNIQNEERMTIWADAVRMQLDTPWVYWLTGHGPGSYSKYFHSYDTLTSSFNFPHNFALELCFESGLIGLTLIITAYAMLFRIMHRTIRHNPESRLAMLALMTALASHLLFCFLTLPVYSQNVILLQTPIIALALHLYRTTKSGDSQSPTTKMCQLP